MITSAMPSEGKSTISALLALSLANIGEKVLLVSMDIRRPFLAKYLNVQESAGLTDFLVGSVKLENIMTSFDDRCQVFFFIGKQIKR